MEVVLLFKLHRAYLLFLALLLLHVPRSYAGMKGEGKQQRMLPHTVSERVGGRYELTPTHWQRDRASCAQRYLGCSVTPPDDNRSRQMSPGPRITAVLLYYYEYSHKC